MNEEDKKFEDFIQGLYDTDKEPSDEEWLDNIASAMVPMMPIKKRDNVKSSEI